MPQDHASTYGALPSLRFNVATATLQSHCTRLQAVMTRCHNTDAREDVIGLTIATWRMLDDCARQNLSERSCMQSSQTQICIGKNKSAGGINCDASTHAQYTHSSGCLVVSDAAGGYDVPVAL